MPTKGVTIMSQHANPATTKRQQQPGIIRPCTAQRLIYRAYKRSYGGSTAQVVSLFASGYYGDAPWTMFFAGVAGKSDTFTLMEKVPTIVYFIETYYTATHCSGVGLSDLGDSVTIIDGYGEHTVPLEDLG
ncbi:MAG TPA: hypothetical protein VGU66_22625 [Candidatus Elarobacter sp.]|nr:hypothetical protein [Candidatus Elarobacter sp.]